MIFSLDQFFFMGAKNFATTGIRFTGLSIHGYPHQTLRYESLDFAMLQPILYQQLRSTRDHSKMMNKSVKNSFKKSKDVLEEKLSSEKFA